MNLHLSSTTKTLLYRIQREMIPKRKIMKPNHPPALHVCKTLHEAHCSEQNSYYAQWNAQKLIKTSLSCDSFSKTQEYVYLPPQTPLFALPYRLILTSHFRSSEKSAIWIMFQIPGSDVAHMCGVRAFFRKQIRWVKHDFYFSSLV